MRDQKMEKEKKKKKGDSATPTGSMEDPDCLAICPGHHACYIARVFEARKQRQHVRGLFLFTVQPYGASDDVTFVDLLFGITLYLEFRLTLHWNLGVAMLARTPTMI